VNRAQGVCNRFAKGRYNLKSHRSKFHEHDEHRAGKRWSSGRAADAANEHPIEFDEQSGRQLCPRGSARSATRRLRAALFQVRDLLHSRPVSLSDLQVRRTHFADHDPGSGRPEGSIDADELEEQREPFRKEFKSQLFSAPLQINTAARFRCSLEENNEGGHEPAAICRPCYDHLQERADLMEAALHIDLKEAAQIVYEAVWSDPSDPTKTYQNAAQALLTELRKRSGINMILFREAQRLSPHRPQSRRCRKRISVMFGEDKDPDIPIVKQAKAEYAKL